jgi:hypothetical protein
MRLQLWLVIAAVAWPQSLCYAKSHAEAANQLPASPATPWIDAWMDEGVSGQPSDHTTDSWRLIHTPGSHAGTDYAAIMHVADLDRSDPRLAGIMLRCSQQSLEIVIVVVEPFPPQARPRISLRVAGQESYFVGSVIPTGAGILLPVDGMRLATGPWRESTELGVKIIDGETAIEGIVTLSGLKTAIQSLAGCAPK